jgi:hypothetical protein
MADAMQGIMSLGAGAPEGAPPSPTPELSPEALQGLTMAQGAGGDPRQATRDAMDTIQEADPELVLQFRQMLASIDIPDELLDAMGKMVDTIMAEPQRYAEIRENFIKEGVPEDLLPPEFDPSYFMAFNLALDELAETKAPVTQNFAQGGIATLNPVMKGIASMGRNQDTQLAHIMPSEARMLRRYGGSGTMNPRTGLPEFFIGKVFKSVGKAFKAVGNAVKGAVKGVVDGVKKAVKSITSSTIGKIALTMAAVYFLGPMVAQYTAGTAFAGVSTGITAGLANTGIALASGANLKDALKQGVIAGVTSQAIQYGSDKLGFSAAKPGQGAPVVDKSVVNVDGKLVDAAEFIDDAGGPAVMGKVPEAPFMPQSSQLTTKAALESVDDGPLFVGNKVYESGLAKGPSWNTPRVDSTMQTDAIAKAQAGMKVPVSSAAPSSTYALDGSSARLPGVGASDMVKADYLNPAAGTGGGSSFSASNLYNKVADKVSNAYQGTKDIYNEYLSPSGIQSRGATEALAKVQEMYPGVTPEQIAMAPANSVIGEAYRNALPGTLATYGPLALTGAAAAYGLGAFESQPAEKPEPPTLGSDVFAANPQDYLVPPGGVATQYYGGVQGAQFGPQRMKTGGIADLPTKFPRKNGPINGPGTGTSDDIPAMLSDGEFVFTAKAVRNMGGGSRRLGAKRMYTMMKALEKRSA